MEEDMIAEVMGLNEEEVWLSPEEKILDFLTRPESSVTETTHVATPFISPYQKSPLAGLDIDIDALIDYEIAQALSREGGDDSEDEDWGGHGMVDYPGAGFYMKDDFTVEEEKRKYGYSPIDYDIRRRGQKNYY